ncbi:MAG: hypothetical protein IT239_04365, partial [Bacteroidia bacterium]|nr:hypothetical protein [Bacteroidia bacterium]
ITVSFPVIAQEVDYTDKHQLLSAIKKYLTDSTAYQTDTATFYSNYSSVDSGAYFYVYVSERNKPQSPKGYNNFNYFGKDSIAAIKYANENQQKKTVTFLHKTAGTSAARINTELLKYYNEEISFIIFHEATHLYISKFNATLPYIYVEALCDAAALSLLNRFSNTYPKWFNTEAVKNFITSVNSIHSVMTTALVILKDKSESASNTLKKTESIINDFLPYSLFLKQRYAGPVNMAWLLKNKYYSGAYYYCKMFVGFSNTIIMTQQLSKVFEKEKNNYFNEMIEKELYLYTAN